MLGRMQEKTDDCTLVGQSRLSIQVENTEYTRFVKTGQNIRVILLRFTSGSVTPPAIT